MAADATSRPKRRVLTPNYKLMILAEWELATEPGKKAAILRREGLYSSMLSDWRRQAREGSLVADEGRSEGGRLGPAQPSGTSVRLLRNRRRDVWDVCAALVGEPGRLPRHPAGSPRLNLPGPKN